MKPFHWTTRILFQATLIVSPWSLFSRAGHLAESPGRNRRAALIEAWNLLVRFERPSDLRSLPSPFALNRARPFPDGRSTVADTLQGGAPIAIDYTVILPVIFTGNSKKSPNFNRNINYYIRN